MEKANGAAEEAILSALLLLSLSVWRVEAVGEAPEARTNGRRARRGGRCAGCADNGDEEVVLVARVAAEALAILCGWAAAPSGEDPRSTDGSGSRAVGEGGR